MKREEAAHKLSEYVLGQLDADTAEAVAEQIAADADLQRMEEFLRWLQPRLQNMPDHLPGPHATGEELVHAATGQGDISNQREDWVRDHLDQCPECRDLMSRVQAADRDLQQSDRPGGQRNMGLGLAAVVALIVITSTLWVWTKSGDAPISPDPIPVVQLAGITRGDHALTTIQSTSGGQLPHMLLECDPWIGRVTADDFTLEIKLLAADSVEALHIWKMSTQEIWNAEQGGLILEMGDLSLAEGDYWLEVRDENRQVIFQTGFHLLLQ